MAQVSIIIPTYNRANWLPLAVKSAKTAGNGAEVIVVDNGSTDETPEICSTIPGIRYLRLDPNRRQARARNAGIEISTGEYLVFLDDDDQRLPNSLEAQVKVLDSDATLGFVYGRVMLGDPDNCLPTGELSPNECVAGDLFWKLLEKNFINLPSVLARRSLVESVGMFDPEVVGAEDWMLLIRLAEQHAVGVVEMPVALYRTFNYASAQASSNRVAMCRAGARAQAKALLLPRALEVSAARRSRIRQRGLDMLSMELISEAHRALSNHMPRSAARHLVAALQLNPRRALTLRLFKWMFFSPWTDSTAQSLRPPAIER